MRLSIPLPPPLLHPQICRIRPRYHPTTPFRQPASSKPSRPNLHRPTNPSTDDHQSLFVLGPNLLHSLPAPSLTEEYSIVIGTILSQVSAGAG